jgi:hypothetical protein
VFNRLQPLSFVGLSGAILLLISACTQLSQTDVKQNPSVVVNPPQFELKPINDQGGQVCTNGEKAFGPITQKMVQKCLDWGGGNSCTQTQWTESVYINAYGSERCPEGSRFNSYTGHCVEDQTALGPFSPSLVAACEEFGGGNACQNKRWDSQLFNHLIRQQGKVQLPVKPPQFVLFAFDGSYSLDAWQKSRNFAKTMNQAGKPIKFTYFISGVYFVSRSDRKLYDAPAGKGLGRSAIGWGGKPEEILPRLEQMNLAYQEGHEIASHAVGHFNGSKWTQADWRKEFDYFDRFIFEAYSRNNLTGSLAFDRSVIQGFRAPLLAQSPGLYEVLAEDKFRYDTSKIAKPNYWPQKQNGVWNFPLGQIKTALTGKNTLSMDYNFYYAHSRARPNPKRAKFYEEDTFKTYMNYFQQNYQGNRAPIDIGHHFSAWNDGAYWDAMFRFAEEVCGLSEVQCVTYSELADFMDLLTPQQIAAYQKGEFDSVSSQSDLTQISSTTEDWCHNK